jgi:hypothetical protein
VTGRPTAVIGQPASRPGTAQAVSPRAAPIIVLAHPHCCADGLLSLLSDSGGLACTSGTGVLPLCHQAATVWRRAEGNHPENGPISTLAAASMRAGRSLGDSDPGPL